MSVLCVAEPCTDMDIIRIAAAENRGIRKGMPVLTAVTEAIREADVRTTVR